MAKHLAGYISQLKELYPDDILDIRRTVNPLDYDATAILEHLTNENRFPLVHFKSALNVRGEVSECTLVSNVYAARERCAIALDFPRNQCKMPLSLEYARREQRSFEAETIAEIVTKTEAPVKEVVEVGDDVDLGRLPLVKHYEMDLGPYLTMACVMRDPDEGFYDVSFVKSVYKGPRKLGTVLHSPHFQRLFAKYEKRGEPAPIAMILGHHPAFYLGSLSLAPWGNNDYDSIGAFLGEPLRLAPSETWGSDFLIPADAEIIVEGQMAPGVREIVNPFGEFTRQYQAQTLRPVTNVTAVTRRRNAILQDIFSGHQGHWNLGAIPKEGGIYNYIEKKYGGVKAVHMPHSGCGRLTCYVSIKKQVEGQAKLIAMEVLGQTRLLHGVVVVDDDIDVFNETDVMWAIVTSVNPKRDVNLLDNVLTSAATASGNARIIIDATRPLDVPFPSRIKVPDKAMARIKLEEWIDQEEA